MIDYFRKKHCCLVCDKPIKPHCMEGKEKFCSKCRCKDCIWRDEILHKCILSVKYDQKTINLWFCLHNVDQKQQNKLSDPKLNFIWREGACLYGKKLNECLEGSGICGNCPFVKEGVNETQ